MNEPKLRFPEFSGEWVYISGNELFEPITNKNHNSNLPILALTQDQGAVPREMINYNVIVSEKSVSGYKVVEADDFIISLRSFQGGIEYSRYKGLCSPAYIVLRKKDKNTNSDFYRIYFKSFNYIQALNKNLEGIRDGKMISYNQFSEIKLPSPSPAEQQKIASCLSAMDDLIAAQAEKVEALKEKKTGLMQQLFPQPGETTPRLRFPEFTGEWEEKKVKEIFEITRGQVLPAAKTKPEVDGLYKYPVYSSQTMRNGLMGYYNEALFNNAITWTTDGANAGTVRYRKGDFYCTNVCGVLLSKDGYANECIAELLNIICKSHVSFVGNPKLMNNVMAEIVIPIPSLQEQQKIASCLSALDDQIAAETEKLTALKDYKKGLMQQLFPQPAK